MSQHEINFCGYPDPAWIDPAPATNSVGNVARQGSRFDSRKDAAVYIFSVLRTLQATGEDWHSVSPIRRATFEAAVTYLQVRQPDRMRLCDSNLLYDAGRTDERFGLGDASWKAKICIDKAAPGGIGITADSDKGDVFCWPLTSKGSTLTETKSCAECPSFLAAHDDEGQVEYVGKALGIAWCRSKQIPLGSLDIADDAVQSEIYRTVAEDCDLHGEAPVDPQGRSAARFAEPSKGEFHKDPAVQEPASCTACIFHVAQSVSLNEIGIPLAGCTRFGDLILPGQEAALAKNCPDGAIGTAVNTWRDATLLSPWAEHLTVIEVAPNPAASGPAPIVDPATYPTDAEVSAEDAAAGIRAWRKVDDPDGTGNSVLLPIFDAAHFDDIDRAKIPQTGDDEHPELYCDHQGLAYKMGVLWRHMGETPALNGVPGVGKTEVFRYLAWMMQLPFERISITGSTEVDDLQGRFVLEGGETVFHYGRVPAAWQRPCVIVIDEPNTGPPEVWQVLRPLTDNSKQLVVDANKGERIARHPHCYLGMAFNPSWDMRNVGTHEIADADGSRLMHIAVPEPDEKLERKILRERCSVDGYAIPAEKLDAILRIAADIRELAKQDQFPMHWGTRQQIKVARASRWFTLEQAYRLAAGDLIDPEANEQLVTIVRSHVPDGASKDGTPKYSKGGAIPKVPF